jgi:type II secretory pathway component GspD/PulD (secretin)
MNDFPTSPSYPRSWTKVPFGLIAAFLLFSVAATGQNSVNHVTPNLKNADLTRLVEAVSMATNKSFIIDPRVHATVTMLSQTALTPAAFYDRFLSLLSICGFVAVPNGNVITILPAKERARPDPTGLPDPSSFSCVAH